MTTVEKAERLELLRKRARMAYLYLGCGLLLVIAATYSLSLFCGAAVGLLLLGLYWFFLRKDIRRFESQYRGTVVLHCIGKEMQAEQFVSRDLWPMEQVAADGCVPVNISRGIVRSGVIGTYHGCDVQMSDISGIYRLDQRRTLGLSGCYIRIHLPARWEKTTALCTKWALPEHLAETCYAAQGLVEAQPQGAWETVEEDWLCYTGDPGFAVSGRFAAALRRLCGCGDGRILLKLEGEFLYAFVRSRYLGVVSPVYKSAVTEDTFSAALLPELKDILLLAQYAAEEVRTGCT